MTTCKLPTVLAMTCCQTKGMFFLSTFSHYWTRIIAWVQLENCSSWWWTWGYLIGTTFWLSNLLNLLSVYRRFIWINSVSLLSSKVSVTQAALTEGLWMHCFVLALHTALQLGWSRPAFECLLQIWGHRMRRKAPQSPTPTEACGHFYQSEKQGFTLLSSGVNNSPQEEERTTKVAFRCCCRHSRGDRRSCLPIHHQYLVSLRCT